MRGQKKRKKCSGLLAVRALLFFASSSSIFCTCCSITHSLSVGSQSIECMLSRERVFRVCARSHGNRRKRERTLTICQDLSRPFPPPNRAAASPGPARQLLSPRGQDVPDAKLRRRDYIQAEPGRSPQCGMPGPTRPAYYHILV